MIRNTVIKQNTCKRFSPQVKKIREQPRHQIRRLLRSFEPLETFKEANKAKP
ncbi:MAG: hypothetical protein ABIN91_05035 [Mucilaginibacter sp.]|uniref:hypothetical protein n=1 Tax=Mucilaginibacter sp. TaxID=1882438 RepID=UPI0032660A94